VTPGVQGVDRGTASLASAFALALGAAISLGLARFSYALLLPAMRADLGWSYFTSGAMNTANAAGYLVGALLAPRWLARFDARRVLVAGGIGSVVMLAAHAFVRDDAALYMLRGLTGVASAASFVSGGLLAVRLAQQASRFEPPRSAGLVLGLYYGGTGVGIVVSSLLVPPILAVSPGSGTSRALAHVHGWPIAWIALALAALVATLLMARFTRGLAGPPAPPAARGTAFRWTPLGYALAGYLMFGIGYIGYMTFVVTLLREQGLAPALIVAFYTLLGLGVIASSWLWAALLQRYRGGQPMALLNALLALATALPVLSSNVVAVFVSGALFGAVFLSVVASTTALVRHNLAAPAWPAGIAAFTIVFAAGQIVGPSLVGWVADGSGGLARGLVLSAAVLGLGAALASRQRALPSAAQ
jgi:predicted MFS family arabinose efflux permease